MPTGPVVARPSVAIIGAGFSGVGLGVALRRAGLESFTIYERGDDVGGVWRENTYPGAACDVPSYLYSYSWRQRRRWTRPCSPQQEILDYLRETAAEHDLYRHLRTGAEVQTATFDEAARRWRLVARGTDGTEREDTADVLVVACGQLSRPSWPSIPGRERFGGHSFHSAEWDHGYDMTGKRVAVIGTGASAVQFVPLIAEQAAHLEVYQRTPPWMLPRRNNAYTWLVRALIQRLPGLQAARRLGMEAFMEVSIKGLTTIRPIRWSLYAWSAAFMRRQVRDPELRRRTKPDYPIGCKRVLFSSHYLPTLARSDVELVTDPIREITEDAVVTADGTSRPVDCIVYGTGFRTNDFVLPMRVTGAAGLDLQQAWAGGAAAHLGLTVPGFPNLFLLYGPNTNLGIGSIVVMIEAQVRYVVDAVGRIARRPGTLLEVRPEVWRASDERTQEQLRHSVWTSCRSWYRDASGRVANNWPGTMREYVTLTRRLDPAEYRELEPTGSGG